MNARRIVLALAMIVVGAACTNKDDGVGGDPSPRKKATASTGASAGDGPSAVSVTLDPSQGTIGVLLEAEATKAKSMSLKPFAEFRADWCGPCVAIEKSMNDARMVDAFVGTYVVHLDVDAWGSKDLAGTGFHPSAIPVFYELDDRGKPTGRTIDGGAWGENVPENMAPPLKAFFRGK
jgi:hypothetical protein